MDGLLIIDKDKNITSRDAVNIVVKKLGTKRVGHTGTLDPLATGVLVVCVGKYTKLVDMLTCEDKEYEAAIVLGISTDTLDITGKQIKSENVKIPKSEIQTVLNSFIGTYQQEVPIYSAVKINGKKLYEYARANEQVELPKREVKIKDLKLIDEIKYKDGKTYFKISCIVSKGTYIRSLIRDISERLNTIGCMLELRRVRQGIFNISNSISLESVSSNDLISIKDVLDIKKINVDETLKFKVLNGQILDNIYGSDQVMFMDNDLILAIYKLKCEKMRPYIMLGGVK